MSQRRVRDARKEHARAVSRIEKQRAWEYHFAPGGRVPWWAAPATTASRSATARYLHHRKVKERTNAVMARDWTPNDKGAPTTGPFAFLLRSFDEDGQLLIRNAALDEPPTPLETAMVDAAAAVQLDVYALRNPGVTAAPRGIAYKAATDAGWKREFRTGSRDAEAVLLLVGESGELGSEFVWEIRQIARSPRLRKKVIVVSHPAISMSPVTRSVFHLLGWPVPVMQPLVAHMRPNGKLRFTPSLGLNEGYLSYGYEEGLSEALIELSPRAEPRDGLLNRLESIREERRAQLSGSAVER